jgi:hypothetical protein
MSPRVLVCPALVAALFLSACATDPVTAHSGAAGGKGTGTVVVQLDRAIPGLGVIVDDETVVEGAHTDQITVDGVEPGGRRIRVVASSITWKRIWPTTAFIRLRPMAPALSRSRRLRNR